VLSSSSYLPSTFFKSDNDCGSFERVRLYWPHGSARPFCASTSDGSIVASSRWHCAHVRIDLLDRHHRCINADSFVTMQFHTLGSTVHFYEGRPASAYTDRHQQRCETLLTVPGPSTASQRCGMSRLCRPNVTVSVGNRGPSQRAICCGRAYHFLRLNGCRRSAIVLPFLNEFGTSMPSVVFPRESVQLN